MTHRMDHSRIVVLVHVAFWCFRDESAAVPAVLRERSG